MCVERKGGSPQCVCVQGFKGADCSEAICVEGQCANKGVCVVRNNVAECSCPPFFSGLDCRETTVISTRSSTFVSHALEDGGKLAIIMAVVSVVTVVIVGIIVIHLNKKQKEQEEALRLSAKGSNENLSIYH